MIIKDDKKIIIKEIKSRIMYDVLEELKKAGITKEEIDLCLNLVYAEDQQKFMKDTIKQKLNKLFEKY